MIKQYQVLMTRLHFDYSILSSKHFMESEVVLSLELELEFLKAFNGRTFQLGVFVFPLCCIVWWCWFWSQFLATEFSCALDDHWFAQICYLFRKLLHILCDGNGSCYKRNKTFNFKSNFWQNRAKAKYIHFDHTCRCGCRVPDR